MNIKKIALCVVVAVLGLTGVIGAAPTTAQVPFGSTSTPVLTTTFQPTCHYEGQLQQSRIISIVNHQVAWIPTMDANVQFQDCTNYYKWSVKQYPVICEYISEDTNKVSTDIACVGGQNVGIGLNKTGRFSLKMRMACKPGHIYTLVFWIRPKLAILDGDNLNKQELILECIEPR